MSDQAKLKRTEASEWDSLGQRLSYKKESRLSDKADIIYWALSWVEIQASAELEASASYFKYARGADYQEH